jgi:hypothetical protein
MQIYSYATTFISAHVVINVCINVDIKVITGYNDIINAANVIKTQRCNWCIALRRLHITSNTWMYELICRHEHTLSGLGPLEMYQVCNILCKGHTLTSQTYMSFT